MSLFNRPSWAKANTTPADADEVPDNIFSHSNRSYREIVAEQERKKAEQERKKQASLEKEKQKAKDKEERRSAGKRDFGNDVHTAGSSPKRRRVSLPDEDESDATLGTQRREMEAEPKIAYDEDEDLYEASDDEIRNPAQRALRRTPRKSNYDASFSPQKEQYPSTSEVVELGDSDGDEEGGVKLPAVVQTEAIEVVDDESDDEFAELARRARQQRQREAATRNRFLTDSAETFSTGLNGGRSNSGIEHSATPPPDPTIELFISSRIENTKEMIVYRKLSQNLKDVRRVWCERQRFSDRKAAEVYFAHRMRRVYDVTTCRSLGIEVDSLGNLTVKGADANDNVEKVHLEAVTDEIFQQMQAERANRNVHGNDGLEAATEDEESPSAQLPAESYIRLTLKAKGREDFKLKVKQNTLFERIIGAYRRTQGVGDDYSVRLAFDGEQLAPEDEVQATEISDLDCIDVHLIPRG